jgi:YgiT-type zinc finger domain-containing protein
MEAEKIRNKSDYNDFYIASKSDAEQQIINAIKFIKTMEEYIINLIEQKNKKLDNNNNEVMLMDCILCKYNLVPRKVNHIVDLDGHIIIIKEVPANVCKQCGEYFIDTDIALKLEKIIEDVMKNKAEIFVVNYFEAAA